MVIHLENTTFTCRTMMRTVGLASLALFTKPGAAGRFDGERRKVLLWSRLVCRQGGVAGTSSRVEWRPRISPDGSSIGPVEEKVE